MRFTPHYAIPFLRHAAFPVWGKARSARYATSSRAYVIPLLLADESMVRKVSWWCAFLCGLLLFAYLVAVVALVHDETKLREMRRSSGTLAAREEALNMSFFGRERLDALSAFAATEGLVAVGTARSLVVAVPDSKLASFSVSEYPVLGP